MLGDTLEVRGRRGFEGDRYRNPRKALKGRVCVLELGVHRICGLPMIRGSLPK